MKPDAENIQGFKANLDRMLALCDSKKDEEFNKNLLSDFLKKSFYGDRYFINTKENSDLVIHNGKGVDSAVGVIFETKKPTKTNSVEMPRVDNLNRKAFQQLVLYFLRERVAHGNVAVKHLVVTNIYEWFIFDAKIFEELFFGDKELVKNFQDFGEGRLSGTKTDFFYKQISEPAIAKVIDRIKFTHFDLRDLENLDLTDLYKTLSPEHLLKLPFANDSNSLNKPFYNELLYIIGLTETKSGGKKLIGRMTESDRHDGSLIENAISRLDSLDKISQLKKPEEFGDSYEERLFNVALRLSINPINRILFLKLLEAQLIKYHQGDRDFAFLNLAKVQNYDDLDSLFFDVLAREQDKREAKVKAAFANVPYLNSSLFEPTETEQQTIVISNLKDRDLPIFSGTVLKDGNGNRRSGELNALAYLFEFLDAYKFDRDELEDTQEDSEKLINASVLGLIFEKINGYKDGSFYTPSFITMYMCRETIRRAVVQKFSEVKGWNCQSLDDLHERIEDKKEANAIINSLKICDPAVGSGHFLVSALNEVIAIKSELRVLLDRSGKSLKDYRVEVRNDKLLVYDDEGKLFAYHPNNAEKQRVQEALFHAKQTIIESCLFGVDINPNSVTICRLRLWIELLKNAYYRADGNLETLPNIDINIKCGNSLISRFGLDVDVKQVLKKQKFSIEQYRGAVQTYRSAESKAQKREMESLIAKIKAGFSSSLLAGDPKKVKLRQLQAELYSVENQMLLLEETKAEAKAREKKVNKLNNEIDKLTAEIEDIESGRLYENALEWRFEFPEVLNDQGDFVGFDVVIGNPPYGVNFNRKTGKPYESNYQTFNWRGESYTLFTEQAVNLLNKHGYLSFIIPDTLLNLEFTESLRNYLLNNTFINEVDLLPSNVFADATVDTILLFCQSKKLQNKEKTSEVLVKVFNKKNLIDNLDNPERRFNISTNIWIEQNSFNVQSDQKELAIIQRIDAQFSQLESYSEIFYGIKVYQVGKGKPPQSEEIRNTKPFTSNVKKSENWLPFFDGKHIGYYQLLWNQDNWLHYGNWLAEPRSPEKFEDEKILIRKITGKTLICHYIPYTSYCNTLLFVLKLKPKQAKISYKALLGVINSGFIGWYFRKKFQISDEDTFPQIMIRDILQFSIPNENNTITRKIEEIVDKILTAKKGDPYADASELEKECDNLVYQLYGLTEEEIKIVEGER
ncbi:Eco57I restriction-modification methylase domain-containing protein [Synechococcus sp. PCC 7502]|uniref:type IIG restriction enzyme/methyltransferase n=1 Tax=Synechococcus sp. PCC 7502 TaxID=1173263 RepID=UPI0002FDD588|nr:TaqI-like C-terminal specificity domain-containing protein [Synechococcus sp. PCC 7502]